MFAARDSADSAEAARLLGAETEASGAARLVPREEGEADIVTV